MAEVMKKNLVLAFKTPTGETVKVTVNTPKEELTPAQISTAMDAVIASKALGEDQTVNLKEEAKYVIQEVEAIEL